MRLRRSLPLCLLALAPLLLFPGCERDEPQVTSYAVPQPQREKLRLLTAIVPIDKVAYVVKLSGPEAEVAAQASKFSEFVRSIHVDNAADRSLPQWKVPAGWKEQPGGSEMRVATFRIEAERPLEVAVTRLPAIREGVGRNSVFDNLNRWRGQLDLPPAEPGDVDKLVRRETVAGRQVILADLTGTGIYRRPAAPVAAAPANPHAGLPLFNVPKAAKQPLPFRYTAPKDWEPLRPLPAFASEAFQVADGPSHARITLSLVQGSVAANITRWRGMLGLPAVNAAELEKMLQPIRVAGKEAILVDLANPAADTPDNHILGVIVPTQGTNLFIKMAGPDALVSRQKANFEAFIESFQPARE